MFFQFLTLNRRKIRRTRIPTPQTRRFTPLELAGFYEPVFLCAPSRRLDETQADGGAQLCRNPAACDFFLRSHLAAWPPGSAALIESHIVVV